MPARASLHHRIQLRDPRRYSRAREGVALRAGAVLDHALGGGTGKGAGAGRKGKSGRGNGPRMARTQQDWGEKSGFRPETLMDRDFKWWLRRASIP